LQVNRIRMERVARVCQRTIKSVFYTLWYTRREPVHYWCTLVISHVWGLFTKQVHKLIFTKHARNFPQERAMGNIFIQLWHLLTRTLSRQFPVYIVHICTRKVMYRARICYLHQKCHRQQDGSGPKVRRNCVSPSG
jgi:hypothetical protein